jgi:hypothetical protein
MIVALAMVVSLTPALSQRERAKRSAPGATFTVSQHENAAETAAFCFPGERLTQ